MARASLFGIPPTVMYDHPNDSDASTLYLNGNPEPLRRMPTPEVEQPQLQQRDPGPRLRRKTAIRGSLRLCDDSVGEQNPIQRSIGEIQPLFELSDISLGRQISTISSRSVSSAPGFGAELTRAPYDPIPQAGMFIRKQKRRSAGIFHQLKRCFQSPFQDSSSSTEESAPARLRMISNERYRPRSIGWPSRLYLANRPIEHVYPPPPMLEAIPKVSSDIASWLAGVPDLMCNDALSGESDTVPSVAESAGPPGIKPKQEEHVEQAPSMGEDTTDFFYY